MEIKIAKYAGFCIGVKKAVDRALSAVMEETVRKPIFSLGHLVHNSFVVAELEKKGVIVVHSIEETTAPGTLIISAHGVPPRVYEQARKKNLEVIDTTCVQVKKVQNLAQQLREEGYTVVIIGDKNHPEVKGVKEWAGAGSYIISAVEEVNILPAEGRLGVISQTTISQHFFDTVSDAIKRHSLQEPKILKTICSATSTRQQSAVTLAGEVDLMLIIGDSKSANTNRLYELSKQIQPASFLVSEPEMINRDWFTGKTRVGITAGASTPSEIIQAVIDLIKAIEDDHG